MIMLGMLFPLVFSMFIVLSIILMVKNSVNLDLNQLIKFNKRKIEITMLLSFLSSGIFLFFTYRNSIGLGYCINLILELILIGYWGQKNFSSFIQKKFFIMSLPIIIIGCSILFIDNQFMWFNIMVVIPVLISWMIVEMVKPKMEWNIKNIFGRVIIAVIDVVYMPIRTFLPMRFLFKRGEDGTRKSFKPLIIGIISSLPIVGVIIALLSGADETFKNVINSLIPDLNKLFLEYIIIFIIVFVSFFYVFISVIIRNEMKFQKIDIKIRKKIKLIYFLPTIIMINILYLIFIIIQFSYLFGNLPEGFTYAEYARKGFFELLIVSLINLLILVVFRIFINMDTKKQKNIYKILSTCICSFTLVLLLSSAVKMLLYVRTYDLTLMRLNVLVFIFYLFLFFIIFIGKIWIEKLYFNKLIILYSICFYTVYNVVDAYSIVVNVNYKVYQKTGKIDNDYIEKLAHKSHKARFVSNKANSYQRTKEEFKWQEFTFTKLYK